MTKGDHPPGWSETALCCIAEITLGQSPPGASYNKTGMGVPFFQGKAEFGDFYPTVKKWTTAPKKRAKQGDILLSVRAPVGPTNLAPFDCAIGRGLHAIRPLDGIDRNFILWSLRASEHRLRQIATGSTFNAVTGLQVKNHKICIAPYREQGRIVERIEELFARLDAVDASLASLLEKLETLRSAILADAFHTNRPLPPGWEKTTIGKVCLKPQYGWTSKSARVKGLPYIRTTDLSGGSVDWESVPSCLTLPDDESKYLLNHGDILVCRAGSVGISYLVTDPPRAVFASYLIRLRTKGGIVDPQYLNLFMQSSAYWNAISETKVGIATPNVNATRLASIPFPLAPRDRQRCIARRVGSRLGKLDILTASMEDCLQTSKILRQSVLAEAFAGRLVPQDPNDEPASVLLDRIRASRQAKPQRRKVRP